MHIVVLRTNLKNCVSKWDTIGKIIFSLMINSLKFILSEKRRLASHETPYTLRLIWGCKRPAAACNPSGITPYTPNHPATWPISERINN